MDQKGWIMDQKILRAWDRGKNKVAYVYRNPETGRSCIGEEKVEWFFFIKTNDYRKCSSQFSKLKSDDLINKIEEDGVYTKLYVDREHNNDLLDKECNFVWEYKDKKLNYLIKMLDGLGIQHYEADLRVYQRWIVSNNIQYASEHKTLFVDIETDDRNITGQPIPGEFRILSVSVVDGHTRKGAWLCCDDDSDEAEEKMLRKLAQIIVGYDVLCAWNGGMFDFPYIKARMLRYQIIIDWRKIFLQDHYQIYKKNGPNLPSYSLDSVSNFVLKRGKVNHGSKIYKLFIENKPLLKEYNMEDSYLMYDVEEKTGFLSVSREMNTMGFCPCDDPYISRKIDMLVLKEAYEGKHYHFKTKVYVEKDESSHEEQEKFTGAYVFDPVLGLHRNIRVLDFSSLYPNAMKTFNISPDTLITHENESDVPSDKIISCPSGQKFRKDFIGILPKLVSMIAEGRARYKALMKTVTPGSNEHKTYDRLQYCFKSYGLSFYGVCGLATSRFFDTRVAESITLSGQFFIKKMSEYLMSKNILVRYGDSVTGDRCTWIVEDGCLKIKSFEELFAMADITIEDSEKERKVFSKPIHTLSYNFKEKKSEFKKIEQVIRHKTDKDIYIYRCRDGVTSCTEDHSIIDKDGNCFTPDSIEKNSMNVIVPRIEQYQGIVELPKFKEYNTKLDTSSYMDVNVVLSAIVDYLSGRECNGFLNKELVKYWCDNQYKIPDFIYRFKRSHQSDFLFKFMMTNGTMDNQNWIYETSNVKLISGLVMLMDMVGIKHSIDYNHETCMYTLEEIFDETKARKSYNHYIRRCSSGEYVYDISVEGNNNFVDSCGNILLHNTDSLFAQIDNDSLIPRIISNLSKLCDHYAKQFNCDESTLEMAYDKGFETLIIVSKKRYAGKMTFVDDHVVDPAKLYVAGLEYKRTDTCPILKKKQEELLKMILFEGIDVIRARKFLEDIKNYILSGKVSIEDITFGQKITKSLDEYEGRHMHKMVAMDMMEDGEEVYVGDKIMYYIEGIDQNDKPIPKPVYEYKGIFAKSYYLNKKILPALIRILDVVFKNVKWNTYLLTKNAAKSGIGRRIEW